MLINYSDRVLGDPDALYCKSRGGGTSATLDQWRSQLSHGLEPVCRCAPPACHALTPPTYSLTAIRKIQRLTWVHPSNAHNCSQRLSAHGRRYQQRAKAKATHSHQWKRKQRHTTRSRVAVLSFTAAASQPLVRQAATASS